MNEKQAKLMLNLAVFVGKLPDHNLNQMVWIDLHKEEAIDDLLGPRCKSSCCALGWAAVLDPVELSLDADKYGYWVIRHRRSGLPFIDGACEYFGISNEEAVELFGATLRTPASQAAMMRKIVAKHGWEEA